jgi:hypothetical protein
MQQSVTQPISITTRAVLFRSGSHGLYSRGAEGEGWKYEYMIISRNWEST